MKVKLLSPVKNGEHSHDVDDVVDFPATQAEELIAVGAAVLPPAKETKAEREAREAAEAEAARKAAGG